LTNFGPVTPKYEVQMCISVVDQQFGFVRLAAPLLDLAEISTESWGGRGDQYSVVLPIC